MESFDINEFLNLESHLYQDEYIHYPIGGLSSPSDPLDLLSDSLLSEITTPPLSDSTKTLSPSLTEEEATHVDNLVYFGVDSPVLPPDILTSHLAAVDMAPCLDPILLKPSTRPTASSVSAVPGSSSFLNPTAADAAPSAHKRSYFTIDPQNQSQEPDPGPSAPRPAKRSRTSYLGESSFQLDPTVAPRPPSKPTDQPSSKPDTSHDYSACLCPDRLTSNRARHWRSCPNNPDRSVKRFTCEICGKKFTRDDNKKRHIEYCH